MRKARRAHVTSRLPCTGYHDGDPQWTRAQGSQFTDAPAATKAAFRLERAARITRLHISRPTSQTWQRPRSRAGLFVPPTFSPNGVASRRIIVPQTTLKRTCSRSLRDMPANSTRYALRRALSQRATMHKCDVSPRDVADIAKRSEGLGFAKERLVEPDGIEPTTSCMPCKRSPN